MDWKKPAGIESVENAIMALKSNGIEAELVKNREDARKRFLEIVPEGSEVMQVSSTTLNEAGITEEIDGGRFVSLRKKVHEAADEKERHELRRRAITPEFGIGSVQAVTEDGKLVIASASGSQIPVYSFGAANVVLVIGTQKVVKDIDMATKRVYEYVLEKESERMRNLGMGGSAVNMLLIMQKPGRLSKMHVIFTEEPLGF